jgi:excisionase family DNA binding protein
MAERSNQGPDVDWPGKIRVWPARDSVGVLSGGNAGGSGMRHSRPLRVDQVQERLSCSKSMVYKLIKTKQVSAFRVGKSWRVHPDSVDDYKNNSHNAHISHMEY